MPHAPRLGGTAVLTLALLVPVACAGGADPTVARPAEAAPIEREYWPTDGWRTGAAGDHGFDSAELAELERALDEDYTSVRSIVVVRDGVLVYERYGDGIDAADGHDVRAVTKSVVSALVGAALADGSIESLDSTLGELLADPLPPEADPRLAAVTLRQLLSMSSGLPADDTTIAGDPTIFGEVYGNPDRLRAGMSLPLLAEPGTQWRYSNVSADLLAVAVADATGRSVLEFAGERLFGPLGIETDGAYEPVVVGWPPTPEQERRYRASSVAWLKDARGYHWGSRGLRLPARDLAKIGFLYLNEGRWDGEQVLPVGYVRESTAPGGLSTGSRDSYGYQWWIARGSGHRAFSARGYGGQVIEVVPDLDLVVVATGDPELPRGDGHALVSTYVVPAAEE